MAVFRRVRDEIRKVFEAYAAGLHASASRASGVVRSNAARKLACSWPPFQFRDMVQRALAPVQFRPPMECEAVGQLPEGEIWQYELKLDGYAWGFTRSG